MKKPKMHVRRDDIVRAISGEDADGKKTGKVLRVYPKTGRVLVEGFNFVKKHLRKSQDNPNGGIVTREAPMAASKLVVVTRGGKKTGKE
ncbi:MAG TPA: 50S ribosomal protein L24 [Kiritimatiellia bacterium]|jgi:large subunit ribosomal protein L24|nr:MAG: 50S ribosomal protein L24 [Verrucomicrobia bacterium ADurb.Bin018]HOE00356.1 50S ribosomal protein L24 [Kiritimatiellia bacterium]HOE36823.1 50S ribosomal protein L24 [Kiritimatiellia bacterium]HOR73373.1 50S ribosomal protein L24 [Kiritimatiellia bacterium]HOU57922.1 50S ribosomal protein L24 [Kiritimatiellia bacterium]